MTHVPYVLPQQRTAEPHKINRNFRELATDLSAAELALAGKPDTTDFEWTTFTPTISVGAGSAPTIGNGTLTGQYLRVGNIGWIQCVFTVGSTTTLGTATDWYPNLPSGWTATYGSGSGIAVRGAIYPLVVRWLATTAPLHRTDNGSQVGYNNPAGWTTGNYMRWGATYTLS